MNDIKKQLLRRIYALSGLDKAEFADAVKSSISTLEVSLKPSGSLSEPLYKNVEQYALKNGICTEDQKTFYIDRSNEPKTILKKIRAFLGLTLKEFGDVYNVTKSTLHYWETGETQIPADAFMRIIRDAEKKGLYLKEK